jgi:hypothetical protein
MPRISANSSCVRSDSSRICRIRSPNCFFRLPNSYLHHLKVCRNLVASTTERDYGLLWKRFRNATVPGWVPRGIGWGSYSRNEESKVPSKSKRTESGILSCAEKTSRFSNEGALIPRSIRLRKSTDIPRSSANCSWLNFLANRIALRRWPNRSRKLGT